jgi:hypothetical protein
VAHAAGVVDLDARRRLKMVWVDELYWAREELRMMLMM